MLLNQLESNKESIVPEKVLNHIDKIQKVSGVTYSSLKDIETISNLENLVSIKSSLLKYIIENTPSGEWVIPNDITKIGFRYALLHRDWKVTSIIIPSSVSYIGEFAFAEENGDSINLPLSITILSSTPPNIEFTSFMNSQISAIYVLPDAVDAYKNATNWNRLSTIIQAIPEE